MVMAAEASRSSDPQVRLDCSPNITCPSKPRGTSQLSIAEPALDSAVAEGATSVV